MGTFFRDLRFSIRIRIINTTSKAMARRNLRADSCLNTRIFKNTFMSELLGKRQKFLAEISDFALEGHENDREYTELLLYISSNSFLYG